MSINNDNNFFDALFIPINHDLKICVFGQTANPNKPAYEIKQALIAKGFQNIYCITDDYENLQALAQPLDLLILCMHPEKSVKLLQNCENYVKQIIIQPGAESPAILTYLNTHKLTYTCGCVLKYFNLK